MDINQLNYFIHIVECGCNLSLAAKKIHISQSALSQLITNFENTEKIRLFKRKNGRLESLTSSGKKIYAYAQKIVGQYNEMIEVIHKESAKQTGTIRIGIPSLILRVFFAQFVPQFTLKNPNVQIEFVEDGTLELRKMLIEKDLNYALLLEPTSLDSKKYEEHVIQIDEMTAFIDKNHPLAYKQKLKWQDILDYPLATFNQNFLTHRLVQEKLSEFSKDKTILLKSSSWDYLVEAAHKTDIVTILPSPINRYLDPQRIIEKSFESPIPFNVLLCRPVKDKYTDVETMLYESILSYFYDPVEIPVFEQN